MKRRKTVRAGRIVWDTVYTVPSPRASEEDRKRIRQVTDEQIARTNCNTAQRKLELLLAANFELSDLVITPTYRDSDLPVDYAESYKRLKKVMPQIRAYRKTHGLPELKYVYVPEGRHGDHRPHFHIIINAAGNDLELFRSLWVWGDDVQLNYISDRGYDGWAGYLTKERREASLNGKKQFVGSRNLVQPTTHYEWVDDGMTIDAPPGAIVLDEGGGRNEIASCKYIKYILPQRMAKAKPKRSRILTGLEWSVTYGSRVEKVVKRHRQEGKTSVQ